MSPALAVVIVAIAVLVWLGFKYATPRGTALHPDDPLWTSAVQRARASVPAVREYHDMGREVWVKFPITTRSGAREHVWGRITAVRGDRFECTIETPPTARPAAATFGVTEIPSTELEDWQVELEDGTIHGGFTTRAEAEIARRDGQSVPRHVEDMIRRMAD